VKLADLIPFRPRRTLSRYADDKAVKDFACVAKDQDMPLDYSEVERLQEIMDDPTAPDEARLKEMAKILGSDPDNGWK
jgi:hypothetical protein